MNFNDKSFPTADSFTTPAPSPMTPQVKGDDDEDEPNSRGYPRPYKGNGKRHGKQAGQAHSTALL